MSESTNQNNGPATEEPEPRENDIEVTTCKEICEATGYGACIVLGFDTEKGFIRSAGYGQTAAQAEFARRLRMELVQFAAGQSEGFPRIEQQLSRIADALERREKLESDTVGTH